MGSDAGADEDGVEDVVDGADDDATPDGEDGGLAPVAVEAEVDGDYSPDKDCADGGDQGEDCGGEGPEDDAGNSEDPIGEAGEDALNGGDGEAAERGGFDGVVDAGKKFGGFVVSEGQEGSGEGEGQVAVAEEEEEDEEQKDELGDDDDGVSENLEEMASDEGGGVFDGVVDVDGVGDGLDAGGEVGVTGEEGEEALVTCIMAEGVDCVDRLIDDLLREQDAGENDRDDHDEEGDNGAEVAVPDL